MKVFSAGLGTETTKSSPFPTEIYDFDVTRGADRCRPPNEFGMFNLFDLWREKTLQAGGEFVFSLMAWANPAGVTKKAAYESLRNEILLHLKQNLPVDIVLLNLHGAMVAEGYEDCESDIIEKVREIVGDDVVIAVELDLHGNISNGTIKAADIVISYKEYPHTDINSRALELFDLAIAAYHRIIRPTMEIFDCRMLGCYPTSKPALRQLVSEMQEAEKRAGVLSISFLHGWPWADVTFAGAKVLVVTDNDNALAADLAKEFGQYIFSLREKIGFDTVPMDDALSRAMNATEGPIVLADQSDNAGGGAPSDSTFVLHRLIELEAQNVGMGIFFDPEVVAGARKAGAGASMRICLGGKWGEASGEPVEATADVIALADDYLHEFPQETGEPLLWPIGNVASLRIDGIELVVSSKRQQCFSPSIFRDLGIDPLKKKILIVKSIQHFYSAFSQIAAETIYLSAPGVLLQDVKQIGFKTLQPQNMYPWTDNPHA